MGAVHQDLEEKERMWVIRLSQGLSAGVCILKIRARAEKHEADVGFFCMFWVALKRVSVDLSEERVGFGASTDHS